MMLRYEVDQAECFRRGIDCEKSIQYLEVYPQELTQEHRNLIAARMSGIDVCKLDNEMKPRHYQDYRTGESKPNLIVAAAPTFEAFMEAIMKDEESLKASK
jgi:hypothetical protein